ncbi:MAG TPA: exodeoxyribonuclease VII small subunit [Thermomicrobiales bacterium]|nr:exodeoxyribonuclease VII small subunit [Thermomicrobiales bacterium]
MTGQQGADESFETLLRQFDELVSALESDDLALDEAIEKYELAAQLARRCTDILENAELRVRQIDEALDGGERY